MNVRLSRSAFLATTPLALAATRTAFAQEPPLRVGCVPTDGFSEAWYAQEMGFFQKAGLNVEITQMANGQGSVTGVAANVVDVGISSVIAIANAAIRGIPMGYIGAGNVFDSANPSLALCVAKDSPVKSAKDFEGQTIAVAGLRDGTNLSTAVYLIKGGADLAKVKFVEMPFPEMAPALKRGTVAAATISEPFVTGGAGDIRPINEAFAAIDGRYLLGGWFSSRRFAETQRAKAAKFMQVIYETGKWANANHQRSGEILEKYSKMSAATIAKMTRATFAENMTPQMIDGQLRWAAQLKFIERPISSNELILRV
jgi:NitT/TauT family transport system substrate-binding protein